MRFLLSLILVLALAAPVLASKSAPGAGEEASSGGFDGPVRGAQAETVDKALKLAPDSRVALTGNIVASVVAEKNHYIFKDSTGEMTVVIMPKQFKGARINPETRIRISGRIEKDPNNADDVRLRVAQLEIVK